MWVTVIYALLGIFCTVMIFFQKSITLKLANLFLATICALSVMVRCFTGHQIVDVGGFSLPIITLTWWEIFCWLGLSGILTIVVAGSLLRLRDRE